MTAKRPKKTKSPREKILDAALKLFAKQGYDATAVPEVARAAGVATGSIYRHFESKEALVNGVFQNSKAAFLQALSHDFPESAPVRQQFSFLIQRLSDFEASSPTRFAFLEMHHHAPYLDKRSLAIEEELMGFLRTFVLGAQRTKLVKMGDPDFFIAIVFGAFVNFVKQRSLGRCLAGSTPSATAELLDACLWDAVRDTSKQPA